MPRSHCRCWLPLPLQAATVVGISAAIGLLFAAIDGPLFDAAPGGGAEDAWGSWDALLRSAAALSLAVDEKKLSGPFLLQANWTCAALWRLAHSPHNAAHARPQENTLVCKTPIGFKLY